MCAIFVVVGNVLGQQPFQVTFIEGKKFPTSEMVARRNQGDVCGQT